MGPVGPRWAPCWPHEPCYQGDVWWTGREVASNGNPYTRRNAICIATGLRAMFLVVVTWWRHQVETFSALLALCAEKSPVTVELPTHRPVTQSFDVFCDLRLNKRLSKQSRGWWFETPSKLLYGMVSTIIQPELRYGLVPKKHRIFAYYNNARSRQNIYESLPHDH